MFEKILIPTDFSRYSDKTIRSACHIPGIREAVLLHVTDSRSARSIWISNGTIPSGIEAARIQLEDDKNYLENQGISTTTRIEEIEGDSIADSVIAFAKDEKVDLIVIGARGKGIITGYLLGSVCTEVLKKSRRHVLITQYRGLVESEADDDDSSCAPFFTKVLCPIDFSKPSMEVIAFLERRREVRELCLLHVIRSAESREELKARIDHAMEEMKGIRKNISPDLKVKLFVRFGNPAKEICDLAEEEDASAIVMPRYGKKDYIRDIPIGGVTAEVAKSTLLPLLVWFPSITLTIETRELGEEEFPLAEGVWLQYHQQRADPETDRIFGLFLEDKLVSVARCRRHPDGAEVDGVFVLDDFRGRGYAREVVEKLVDACGDEPLYMHSTLELVPFYATFGFYSIGEEKLPPSIKARFAFALGEMEGSNVSPMMRDPR
jgi:nucleotide-binding universal stress UspA family protein/predicted GNAT family acetyltransferase